MVSKKDMLDLLAHIAPPELAMDWDNIGLIIDAKEGFNRLLICLDITPAILNEAVEKRADMIISHHPLIFDPLTRMDKDSIVYLAVQSGISVYAAHTNMDVVPGGVNDTLAEMLGVKNCMPLGESAEVFGCIGKLAKPMNVADFAESIEETLDFKGIRIGGSLEKTITTVAVACGAGGDSIFAARKMGADALVSGEAKHHEFVAAERLGMVLLEAGHYHTEKHFVNLLAKHLQEAANQLKYNLQVIISERENPPYVTKI